LFFTDYHDALIHTLICKLNQESGQVIIVGPERGKSMAMFIEKALKVFKKVEVGGDKRFEEIV